MDDLSTLLHDAVADVEPADRLGEIRAAVAARPRRVGWYAAGGTMLAAAAAVTAIAVVTSQTTPRADDPGPGPGTSSPSPPLPVEAVYYIGDTPTGPRLFRYFQSPQRGQDVLDLLTETPADPDYRTAWAAGSFESVTFDGPVPDQIEVTIADASLRDRPAGMTEAEAALAIEQVIYTVQAAARVDARLPVQFRFNGNPIDQVLGVPTSEPVVNAPPLDVLSLVSISDPSEGQVFQQDSTLEVKGVANSFEANVVWRLQSHEGTGIVGQGYFTAEGYMGEKLFPFEGEIDLAGIPAGHYLLMVSTDDPSGQGRFHTDTRTVVVE
jgi:hypothetical protein